MDTDYEFWLIDDRNVLNGLRAAYYAGLTGPVEPWLEEQTHRAYYFAIRHDEELVGYACIDSEDRLLQFYLDDAQMPHAQSLFRRLIDGRIMHAAYVSTRNPSVLSLCMDAQQGVACQAYLFVDQAMVDCPVRNLEEPRFRQAEPADLSPLLAMSNDFFAPTGGNLERGKLYLLEAETTTLAVGMIETDDCHPSDTASLGMFVHPDYRWHGLGAHMIMRLKQRCYALGYTPIAGCWYGNLASKRTLERAGMVTKDRILHVNFQEN
jgi:GNAT superfamily N-acetyltransferase